MTFRRFHNLDEHDRLLKAVRIAELRINLFDRLTTQTNEHPEIIRKREEAAMDLQRLKVDIARVRMRLTVVEG